MPRLAWGMADMSLHSCHASQGCRRGQQGVGLLPPKQLQDFIQGPFHSQYEGGRRCGWRIAHLWVPWGFSTSWLPWPLSAPAGIAGNQWQSFSWGGKSPCFWDSLLPPAGCRYCMREGLNHVRLRWELSSPVTECLPLAIEAL